MTRLSSRTGCLSGAARVRSLWPQVRKGVPFRETHHLSGAAVKMAEDRGVTLFDLSASDLKSIHPLFTDDVLTVSRLGSHRTLAGRPCFAPVQEQRSSRDCDLLPLQS